MPPRILAGTEAARSSVAEIIEFGLRIFVVTGRDPERQADYIQLLREVGAQTSLFSLQKEPGVSDIERALRQARDFQADVVLGLGGGSAIDAAKAIAALFPLVGNWKDYLEIVGRGMELPEQGIPCIAIPTTAGTGAEVTRNSVLKVDAAGVKVSLRHRFLLPRLVIIDPVFTKDLPPALTAASGMDALTQLLESFTGVNANAMTDAWCRQGLKAVGHSLRKVFHDGHDMEARMDMALAALFSGLALANSRLGAVHGFAAPLGGMFEAPHGAVCAALLPAVTEMNLQALQRMPESRSGERYAEAAGILLGPHADATDLVQWFRDLKREFAIPNLGAFGVKKEHIQNVCEKAARASSMKGNPVQLEMGELVEILENAI